MDRLLLTLLIIFTSLSAGYFFRRTVESGRMQLSGEAFKALRIRIQKLAMFVLIPVSAMLSLWGLKAPDGRLLLLPLLGLAAWTLGGWSAIRLSRAMGLSRCQTGSMFCCGSFTNIGAVGCLVSVMLYGEQTIAFASLYRLCEEIFYFAVAYPVARWFSLPENENINFTLRGFRMEPVLKAVLLALGTGIALNIAGVPRPEFLGTVSSCSMTAGTICFLLSIGMGLRLSRMSCFFRESLAISLIKFAITPAVITALAFCFGLGGIAGGLPLKVAVILSAMPVAMNALIPPSLFNLDLDLANACWMYTTLELIIVLPVLILVLPLL